MNAIHLLWIIPLAFVFGVLFYAALQQASDYKMSEVAFRCLAEMYNISVFP